MARRYNEQMQHIVTEYMTAGERWPATTHEIAAWAIISRRWEGQEKAVIDICAEHLARAMREEYIIDPQGRTVRAKHAARIERDGTQLVLWDDIRRASRQHMQIAFQQRRQQIVGDCRQLKADVDSYNENNNEGKPLQMVFDFTLDLVEMELLKV
ncbi:MAG: hypothetical protein IBX68_01760 [Dehalococcoidia bacterium]|nr:hypothetical protein [Dehalococcoidia bacterium]